MSTLYAYIICEFSTEDRTSALENKVLMTDSLCERG